MRQKYILLFLVVLSAFSVNAQQSNRSLLFNLVTEKRLSLKPAAKIALFEKTSNVSVAKVDDIISEKLILSLDKQAALAMYQAKPATISLDIPSVTGNSYTLELIQQDINTSGEFSFGTLEANGLTKKADTVQGLHYRGYINGDPSSIASFSVFSNGEVMGLYCNEAGNFNIGKTTGTGTYVLYNSKHMTVPLGFECSADALPVPAINGNPNPLDQPPVSTERPTLLCKKVRIYWEADYKLYSNNFGSDLTNTVNYLTGLFNQVSTMYENEGILIELTDTYVWITADPYNTSTSSNGLAAFKGRWNGLGDTFKADLAVLIDGAPTNNGGVAYLLTNNLCNRYYAYGYANIYASYNTVPVYSWDVEVVTHEMGHMMGSKHTHWCGWNTGDGGTCGAIDDCYQVETTTACTTCAATTSTNPSAPAGFKGSVMSYCHLRSGIGINLANGFGPLPQAVIRNTVNIASCALYDNVWTGSVSTAWENPANWGCGTIPNATTDVTITVVPSNNYPIINSAAICRRIKQIGNTTILVKDGFSLNLTGQAN